MPLKKDYPKAEKSASMARIMIYGVDGSGKTYTALRIARELSPEGDILVVDTEQIGEDAPRSAQYEEFGHYIDPLPVSKLLGISPTHPHGTKQAHSNCFDNFETAVREATQSGAEVVIIDSWSDENLLYLTQATATGQDKVFYKDIKRQRGMLLEVIKNAPCHIIVCMRSKEQGVWSDGGTGNKPRIMRMALQADGNNDIGYATNLRIAMEDGVARVVKSIYPLIQQDNTYDLVGGNTELYEQIISSLDSGRKTKALFKFELTKRGIVESKIRELWKELPDLGEWSEDRHDEMLETIDTHLAAG